MIANTDDLAVILAEECGKPLAEAKGEISYGASFIQWFAEEGKRMYGDVIPQHVSGRRLVVVKQPVGVAAMVCSLPPSDLVLVVDWLFELLVTWDTLGCFFHR